MIRLALLTTDAREVYKTYDRPKPYFGTAPQALLDGMADNPDLEVHVVSCIQRPASSPVQLASNIFYQALVVPKIGWLRTGYQGCIRAVRRKLRELKPDLVHGQGTERDCAICSIWSGFPNVLTVHGNMRLIAKVNQARPFSFDWLTARLERYALPRTEGVVCITSYTRQAVAPLAKQTWVVPNAVDPTFFDIKVIRPPVQRILVVATISHRKNQHAFIRALDPLAKNGAIEVVFLGATGPDPYSIEFFRLIESRPWCKHIAFSGHEEVKRCLSQSHILVLPSLEDNCPMTVLEAMAAGVPVLASKVGGVPDLIEEGVTGLFCDPSDPESMRQGVQRLLTDDATASSLAARAKAVARERYHPRVVARRHLEIYREVLDGTK